MTAAATDLPPAERAARWARLQDRRRRAIVLEAGPSHPEFGEAFMRYYLPHYVRADGRWVPFAGFHRELFGTVFGSLGSGTWHDHLAPRGYGKSTIVTLALPLAALGLGGLAARGLLPYDLVTRWYVWIVQDSADQAKQSMENLLAETEGNPRVVADFPHLTPQLGKHNRPVASRDDDVVFASGQRLQALGAGMKLRGRRHRQHRPDLALVDDLENDEHVNTKFQRDKLDKWLSSAFAFAVAPDADVHLVGTLLHNDAVLARVRKRAGWRHHRYEAFTGERVACPEHGWRVDPDAPLHPEESCDLCRDTLEVRASSWPFRTAQWHARQRALVGSTAYLREIEHIVTSEDRKRFPESWFRYDDRPHGDDVRVRIGVDPNAGENEQGDPASIVVVMRRSGDRRYHVDYAYSRAGLRGKALTDRVQDVYRDYREQGYEPIVVFESQQAQEWGKQALEDAGIAVRGVKHSKDKLVRAEPVSLHYEMQRVSHALSLRGSSFEATLDAFPDGEHDDDVDALVMAVKDLEGDHAGGVAGAVTHAGVAQAPAPAFVDPRGV